MDGKLEDRLVRTTAWMKVVMQGFKATLLQKRVLGTFAVGLVVAPMVAQGALINYQATGTLYESTRSNVVVPTTVAVGDTFVLNYTVDGDSANLSPQSPSEGFYYDALVSATLRIGSWSHTFSFLDSEIRIANDVLWDSFYSLFEDHYKVNGYSPSSQVTGLFEGFSVDLESWERFSTPNTPITGGALPTASFDAYDFQTRDFIAQFFVGDNGVYGPTDTLRGTVDRISVITPVPLPAAAWLLLSGLGGLGILGRRRKAA